MARAESAASLGVAGAIEVVGPYPAVDGAVSEELPVEVDVDQAPLGRRGIKLEVAGQNDLGTNSSQNAVELVQVRDVVVSRMRRPRGASGERKLIEQRRVRAAAGNADHIGR